MVAIVSGSNTGLINTSAGILGQGGLFGNALHGSSAEGAYVNVYNGNLLLQDKDGFLPSNGINLALTRTYNSQAVLSDASNSGWQDMLLKQVKLIGTLNDAGSTVQRIDVDGSISTYTYKSPGVYVSTDGGGAYQTLTFSAGVSGGPDTWTWSSDRTDLLGVYETYDMSQGGNIVAASDAVGKRLTYTYTKLAGTLPSYQLKNVTDPAGDSIAFTYSGNNLSNVKVTPAGGTAYSVSYTYDAQNRLSIVSIDLTPQVVNDSSFYTTTYVYGPDVNGVASQLITGVKQSDGTRLGFTYDNGRVASYTVYASDTDNVGHTTSFSYGVNGLTTTVTDPLKHVITYGYDSKGQLTSVSVPDVGTTSYTYDTDGNVQTATDARGLTTEYKYDSKGNRVQQRDAAGNTVTRVYAAGSNLLLSETTYLVASDNWTPAQPQTTRYVYDRFNRLRYQVSAEGRVTEFMYPEAKSATSPTQVQYSSSRTFLAALYTLQVTPETQFLLADLDNWSATQSATPAIQTQSQTNYTYDIHGLLKTSTTVKNDSITPPTIISYTYDAKGQLLTSTDSLGTKSSYTYDALGRQLTKKVANSNGTASSAAYSYASGSRTVTETLYVGATSTPFSTNIYTYDAAGELLTVQQLGVVGPTVNAYDADGQLRVSTSPGGLKTYWLYDGAGRQVAQIDATGMLTELVYNQDNQVIRTVRYATPLSAAQLLNLEISDGKGNVADASLASFHLSVTPQDRNNWNFYDRAGRLVDTVDTSGYVTHYEYDGASRLLTATLRAAAIDTRTLTGLSNAALAAMNGVSQTASTENDRSSRKLYDADGLLVGQIDALGHLTEYKYNAAGLLAETITYTALAKATLNYTLANMRPPSQSGDLHEYRIYDTQNQLVGTVDADGYLTEFTYNAAGNISKRTTYANRTTAFDAGKAATNMLTTVRAAIANSSSADNRVIEYTYDAVGRVLTAATRFSAAGTPSVWITTYAYDANGKQISQQVATYVADVDEDISTPQYDGATNSVTYDAQGRVLTQSSGAGAQSTKYQYDANGLLLKKTAPDGGVTVYYYDAAGRPTYTIDPVGHVQQQIYNNFGQVISVRSYATLLTTRVADLSGGVYLPVAGDPNTPPAGLPAISDDDQRTLYSYDNAGRLIYTMASDGEIDGRSYADFGQLQSTVHYGATVSAAILKSADLPSLYSAAQHIIDDTALVNQVSSFDYDHSGRLIYTTDPAGHHQGTSYDDFGNVKTTTQYDAKGTDSVQRYEYNKRGLVVDYTDALGNHIATTYNSAGQAIIQERRATAGSTAANATLDSVTRTIYDETGHIAATIDAMGIATVYQYNGDGKVIDQKTYANAVTNLAVIDAQQRTGNSITTQLIDTVTAGLKSPRIVAARQQFAYDARGRLVASYTAKSGLDSTPSWTVTTYAYNENDQAIARTTYANVLTSTVNPGLQTSQPIPAASTSDARVRMIYDAAGRLTDTLTALNTTDDKGNIVVAPASGSMTTWSLVSLQYDAFGNVTQRTAFATQLSVATATTALLGTAPTAADIAAAKSTASQNNAITVYRYDSANRLSFSATAESFSSVGVRWSVTAYDYNAAGQLKSTTQYDHQLAMAIGIAPSTVPTADPALDRTTVYAYDLANRLISTTDAMNNVVSLEYDARGNVTKQTQHSSLPADAGKDRVTRTYYDLNNRPLYQVDAAGDVVKNTYDALGNLVTVTSYATPVDLGTLDAGGIDKLRQIKPVTGDRIQYNFFDNDGQRVYSVDAGGYLTRYTYDALGRTLTTTTYANKVRDALGTAPATGYPLSAITSGVLSAAGTARITTIVYDAQGNTVQITDPEGFIELSTYDALGNKLSYTNQLSKTWNYSYDAGGHLLKQTDPQVVIYIGGADTAIRLETLLRYDTFGNLISRTEASNSGARVTGYAYDLRGRQTQTVLPRFAVYNAATDSIALPADPGTVSVVYDAFGQAVTNEDVGDKTSFKVYDRLGRVLYDIDALGYVTRYERNGFGDVIALTRYATPVTDAEQGALLDGHQLPKGKLPSTLDRVIKTSYDALGRPVTVTEPAVIVYDQQSQDKYLAARTTTSDYDAFGQVYRQAVYGVKSDNSSTPAAVTRYYYDERGYKSAQIVALSDDPASRSGYLTIYGYDAEGNQQRVLEYANAVHTWDKTTYAKPAPDAADRETSYNYDGNKRLIQETRVGALALASGATSDIVINYQYDATGNQTSAAMVGGVTTITYYDALGRTIAVGQVAPSGDSTSMPVTVFKLDAFGNVLVRTDYINGSSTALAAAIGTAAGKSPTVATNAKNRITTTTYDIAGHAIKVVDANNNTAETAYDVYGRAAKQWRQVTNNQPGASTAESWYQINQYDALGHLTQVTTPGNRNLVTSQAATPTIQQYQYNAFGEAWHSITSSGDTVLNTAYTDYDNAGRVWRTNGSDGIDTVTLYDAQGNATVQIRGNSSSQDKLGALQKIDSAEQALNRADTLRTDTRYDLMGRAVDVRQASSPTLTMLVSKDGAWQQVPVAAQGGANGLLVIGDAQDQNSTITVQCRTDAQSPWVDQPARVWNVGGMVVFNTAGLESGQYAFRVLVQPKGEDTFERMQGEFSVSSSTSDLQDRLVAQLYVVLFNRVPDPSGLISQVQGLNNGGSLATVASGFLASNEGKNRLPADAAGLIQYIFNVFGGGSTADINLWTQRYATALAAKDNSNGQVVTELISALLLQASPPAALLAAQQRISNQVTASLYYVQDLRGNDASAADAIYSKAATDLAAAKALADTLAKPERDRNQVAEAYLILFARAPEPAGMQGWLYRLQNEPANAVIENMLVSSTEATDASLFPPNSDPVAYDIRFIEQTYRNILGRDPSAAEMAEARQWMAASTDQRVRHGDFVLAFADKIAAYTGTDTVRLTQKQLFHNKLAVALRFSQIDFTKAPLNYSADQIGMVAGRIIAAVPANTTTENAVSTALAMLNANVAMATTVAAAMDAALQRTPLETMQLKIAQLYVALFNRTPDSASFAFYVNAFKNAGGTDAALQAIATEFLASDETIGDPRLGSVANMSDLQFVQHIYQLVLGQVPSSQGAVNEINGFVRELSVLSRGAVATRIISGILGFNGLTAQESSLKARFDNKVAVGLATAIDLAPFNWGDKSQPGIAIDTLNRVTATDTQAALGYAYEQAQIHLKAMAATVSAAATAAAATQATTAAASLAASNASDALKLALAQAASQASAQRRMQVMQLYVGLLGRTAAMYAGTPDLEGFNNQVNDAGSLAMGVLVERMLNNPEGLNLYQGLSNDQFVDKVVTTILGSSSVVPPAELAKWRAQLSAVPPLARGQVAFNIVDDIQKYSNPTPDATTQVYLSARQLFLQRVSAAMTIMDGEQQKAAVAAGIAIAPVTQADAPLAGLLDKQNQAVATHAAAAQAASNALNSANTAGDGSAAIRLQITQLYATLLQRQTAPSLSELNFYITGNGKNTPAAIADTLMKATGEATTGQFPSDNAGLVTKLFQLILGRQPDPGEITYWSQQLTAKTGAPYERGQLAVDILHSYNADTEKATTAQVAGKLAFDQKINSFMQQEKQEADAAAATALANYNSLNATAIDAYNKLVTANGTRDSAKALADQAAAAAVDADTVLAQPSWQRTVTTYYLALRGNVDFVGLAFHIRNLSAGAANTNNLIDDLLADTGYPADNESFIKALYSHILNRVPSATEVAGWVGDMADPSITRAVVVTRFMQTSEALQRWTAPINAQLAADIKTSQDRVATRTSTANTYSAALTAATTANSNYTKAANNASTASTAYTTASKLAAAVSSMATARANLIASDQTLSTEVEARNAYAAAKANSDQLHLAYAKQLDAYAVAQPASDADHAAAALATATAASAAASINVAKAYIGEMAAPQLQRRSEQIAQLYVTLFNRAPQLSELQVWSTAMDGGMTLTGMADAMIRNGDLGSAVPTPASLSNDAFVTQMYKFGVGRDFSGDPVGLRYWSDKLSGSKPVSRAELVVGWIDTINLAASGDAYRLSSKGQAALQQLAADGAAGGSPDLSRAIAQAESNARADAAATIPTGTPDPAVALAVAPLFRLYIGMLNRAPDQSGLTTWIRASTEGKTMAQIAQELLTSAEGVQLYPSGVSDRDFLTQVFRNVTGRAPADAEIGGVLAQMGSITRGDAALRLLNGLADGATTTLQQRVIRDSFNAKVYAAIKVAQFEKGSENGYIPLVLNTLTAINSTVLHDLLPDHPVYGIDTTVLAGKKLPTITDQLTLDRWGNVLVQRDARDPNWSVTYTYNDAGQILSTVRTGAAGARITTSNLYNQAGKVIQTTDGNANVNAFQYDANGALLSETHADYSKGTTTSATASIVYTNDAFGQQTAVKQYVSNASGTPGLVTTTYSYDNMGHLLSRTSAAVDVYWVNSAGTDEIKVAGATITDSYTYDELGRRISATNTNSSKPAAGTTALPAASATATTYTRYDLSGNIISVTNALNQSTLSAYDALGHKTAEKVATGETRTWTVDAYGRTLSSKDLGGNLTKYEYNDAGQLTRQYGVTDMSQQVAGAGLQDISYGYDAYSGQLVTINDAAMHQLTTYTYDAAGNRMTEKTVLVGQLQSRALQDNTLRYDAYNRLISIVSTVPGADYHIQYEYDNNGNRKRQLTEFTNDANAKQTIDVRYGYDKMDRVTSISGTDNGVAIEAHTIAYNWMGNRVSDSVNNETYEYDAAGRLSKIKGTKAGVAYVSEQHYDGAGRVVTYIDGVNKEIRLSKYNAIGGLLTQTAMTSAKAIKNTVTYYYDGLNNLSQTNALASGKTQTTIYEYTHANGYLLNRTTVTNVGEQGSKSSEQTYDANRNVATVTQLDKGVVTGTTAYIANLYGQVLEKGSGNDLTHSLFANGEAIGSSSNNYESFSSVYDAVTSPAASGAPSIYVVQDETETLQSIAKAVWGDERLWYLIDEANGGIDGNLAVSQQLIIPTRVNSILNGYDTYAPYNKAAAIGNTTPELAMPAPQSGGGCGVVGKLIMVVVAVAVVAATSGAATNFLGGAANAFASIGGNVIGAMAGSVASQAVGIAIGAQDGLSWKSVAQAGLSGGVTAGVGELAKFNQLGAAFNGGDWTAVASRAALSNAVTQGIANMTGLQHGFSWNGVAGSFIGAAVGDKVAIGVQKSAVFAGLEEVTKKIAIGTISGISAGVATALAHGGKISVTQVATDAFGNALGSSLAARSSGTPDLSAEEWGQVKQEVMTGERTAGLFNVTSPIDLRNSGGSPIMSDSLASFGEGMSSGSVIVRGTRTFDPTKDSLLFNGQNGDGSTVVRKWLPDGSTIDTYANGYNFIDANGNAAFTVADTSDTVLSGKFYQEAADRNYYLSQKYDPNSLVDQIRNIFTGAMNDPNQVMTDRDRTEHESLSNMLHHQTDMALNPEKFSPLLQRIDNVRGSATGTAGYLAAHTAGASQEYRDKFAQLGNGLGGLALARSAAVSGGPAYTGAKGTPDLSPNSGIPAGGAKRVVPLGFDRGSQFLNAAGELKSALEISGITDARIGVRGSSAAGGSVRKGTLFGPQSDIDFFIESAQLSNGRKTSNNIPGMVFTNPLLRDYPLLRDWSNNWSNTLNRKTTPAAFVPGSVPNEPSIWID